MGALSCQSTQISALLCPLPEKPPAEHSLGRSYAVRSQWWKTHTFFLFPLSFYFHGPILSYLNSEWIHPYPKLERPLLLRFSSLLPLLSSSFYCSPLLCEFSSTAGLAGPRENCMDRTEMWLHGDWVDIKEPCLLATPVDIFLFTSRAKRHASRIAIN